MLSVSQARLELRTCCNECLAGSVVSVFLEVLDETLSEVFSLDFPLFGVSVSVARIKDFGIYAGKFSRNLEVEDRKLLGRSLEDSAVKDIVDDTTGITDLDTLAGSVPSGVHEVSLCSALFHALNEFFSVFGRVEFKECLAEAS